MTASGPRAGVAAAPLAPARAAFGNRAIGHALGAGAPLDDTTRAEMQQRYGADFTRVRVHTAPHAAASADALGANAYAIGHDIVFGPGRYAPQSREGRRLLAHELAHVVQQSRGGTRPMFDPAATHEQEANRAADAVVGGNGGPISVEGATAVGVAADMKSWFQRKAEGAGELYDDAKALVPDEVKEVASHAVDIAVEYGPYVAGGPIGGTIADFQRAAYHDIKEKVTGVADPEAKGLRETAAHKIDLAVGVGKGAASQLSDLADTAVWAGTEMRDAKDAAVERTAKATGVDPGVAKTIARGASVLFAPLLPHALLADALGETSDAMKDAGWVDEAGKPSLTSKVQAAYDYVGDTAISALGVDKEQEEGLFTTREKGELGGAIGIQIAGAAIGATEVKVGLAVVGALGGIRGIVETVRAHPNDFYKQPSFWSGFLSTALSIVGLKGKGAAKKVIDIALKSGSLLEVVPHVWQLYNDYNDVALQADEEKYRKTLQRDVNAIVRAVVGVVMMIVHNGARGKKTPAYEGGPPKGGPAGEGGSATAGTPAKATADGGNVAAAPGNDSAAPAAKPPSAARLKKADARVQSTRRKADTADTGAKKAEDSAAAREARSDKSRAAADAQRAKAEKNAQALKDRQATAGDKAQALVDAKQKADAHGGDAKAKAKLDKQALAAEKAAADARTKADNAQKRADASRTKADSTDTKAAAAEKRAQDARAAANGARAKAKKAEAKAQDAKARAEQLRGPQDPSQSFADLNDPAAAAPLPGGKAPGKPDAEPVVWVRTGLDSRQKRWTYVPEGHERFGKNEGVAVPESWAKNDMNAAPDTGPLTQRAGPKAIDPIRAPDGRPLESAGAGGARGSRFVSGTATDPSAIGTSIRADVAEAHVYNHLVGQGEVGILRPQGVNVPGVDGITARIQYDAQGKPVKATIYLNDATSPTARKGAKSSHAHWVDELTAALDPKAPPGQKLDFGNPALEAVIRKAAADGNVHIRVVRTAPTASGRQSVTIDPGETFRAGLVTVPKLPNVAEVRDDDDKKDKKDSPP